MENTLLKTVYETPDDVQVDVYLSDVIDEITDESLQEALENRGYFVSETKPDLPGVNEDKSKLVEEYFDAFTWPDSTTF